jgi:hypothetical protein
MNAAAEETRFQVKLSGRYHDIPLHLLGTDRVLKRWAVSVGDGTEDLRWLEIAKSKFPPLDDQMAIVVDQLVMRAPQRTRKVVERYYRFPDNDLSDIARALNVRRENVKAHWHLALGYFRSRFLESPLSGLRALAATDPTTGQTNIASEGTQE